MNQAQYNQLFSFIWNIATDVLVYAFDKGEYKKIILPMMVLRRIDVLLEPTKQAVIAMNEQLDKNGIENKAPILCGLTGYPFYNTSLFTMKTLTSEVDPARLKLNVIEYFNGFSKDVLDIVEKLHLRQVVDNLTETERLGSILEKFTSDKINLSIKPVLDDEGNEKLPGVDNHTMGTIFEELLRKFNEENNVTEAGEHFTPRDYVKLLADLAVEPIADQITDNTYSIYDGACGTGGILTVAQESIERIAQERGKQVNINIYGQEQAPDTYATCKADLMISGSIKSFQYPFGGVQREYIAYGSTLSQDGHAGENYDFCISNPPFGTPWKEDLKKKGLKETEKNNFNDPRFRETDGEGNEMSFLPDIGDCQMMFLANNLSRMQHDTQLGTRIVEVHNGSSLFTGNAGGGASNLRRHIIENDLLEAIIAMPENDFYNTGIGTYIWVITNRKEERRRGYVQLIDATKIKTSLRKNLGNKNCETNEANRKEILHLLTAFEENEQSKIFPNREFGYWDITVNRPLRLVYENPDDITIPELKSKDDEALLHRVLAAWKEYLNGHTVGDFALFHMLKQMRVKVPASKINLIRQHLGKRSETAEACHAKPTDQHSPIVADKELKDSEQVPLLYEGGIAAFMQNEVLPYAPDAYVEESETKIGYELSFTKYFYKPVQLRSIEEIAADAFDLEKARIDIAKVVTQGLNPDAPMKDSGIPWIGMIPEHWEVKSLRNYIKLVSVKGYGDKQLLSVTREQGVIERNTESKQENHNFIPDDLSGYKLVKEGQFVINKMKSWQGSYGVSKYEGIVSPAYFVCNLCFPCKEFFSVAIRSKAYIPFFTQYSKGIRVDQWDLSPIALKSIPFIAPPLSEQQAIVSYIEERLAKIDSYIANLQAEIERLKEFKQRLISDVVTGQIKVVD